MAKDDFHVIAYRILYYLYNSMKAGQDVDMNLMQAKTYEVNDRYFNMILEELLDNGFIKNIEIIKVRPYNQVKIFRDISITLKGIEYLTDNSFMGKAQKFLKMAKDSVPFI